MKKLDVIYKCACLKEPRTFQCLARIAGEPIEFYMGWVIQPSVCLHHREHSPECRQEKLEWLRIPIFEGEGIGMKPTVQ